jgi:hypothetical protein
MKSKQSIRRFVAANFFIHHTPILSFSRLTIRHVGLPSVVDTTALNNLQIIQGYTGEVYVFHVKLRAPGSLEQAILTALVCKSLPSADG